MRLSEHNALVIRQETARVFGPDARVFLFGSRVDDQRKGGDIDLLVQVDHATHRPAADAARLAAALEQRLGEQRIDIVVEAPNLIQQPIHAVAHSEGVRL